MSSGRIDVLPQHRSRHRLAGGVRHRAVPGGDGHQRRGLALAPADQSAGTDAHQQGVLAAVADITDLGHREVEEINGFDFHREYSLLLPIYQNQT